MTSLRYQFAHAFHEDQVRRIVCHNKDSSAVFLQRDFSRRDDDGLQVKISAPNTNVDMVSFQHEFSRVDVDFATTG